MPAAQQAWKQGFPVLQVEMLEELVSMRFSFPNVSVEVVKKHDAAPAAESLLRSYPQTLNSKEVS